MVEEVGQFSVRGGIFDIYGFGMADPARLEFWGDEIAELRHFDLLTQRSTRPAEVVVVLPVDGAPVADADSASADRVTLPDLWPPDTIVLIPAGAHLEPELRRTWEEAQHHVELARRRGEDAPPREELYQSPDATVAALAAFATIVEEADAARAEVCFPIRPPDPIDRDISRLARIARDGIPTLILCDNAGQCERLDELLADRTRDGIASVGSPATLAVGVLDGGFLVPPVGAESGLRVLTDHEIFRRERRIRRARRYAGGTSLEAVTALKPGDYVVHLEHGVGIFRGIETIFVKESTVEVAVVEYEGGDRLNVPLYRIDQLERYRAASDVTADAPPPRLHKLGGRRWAQQRDRTRAAIQEMTTELLELYARRQIAHRPPHAPDGVWQRQLESSFLFEDTPDQRKATGDVKSDMERIRPMDRLLVGDVGYGKTEIAVRAAFKAIQSGRQIGGARADDDSGRAASAHVRRSIRRFPDAGRGVESIPDAPRNSRSILADLAAKKIDVLIGTHRLLSPDVTVRRSGTDRDRRGASVWRAAQGAAQAAATRDGRPHADGDADSADAAPVARRACAT